MRKSGMPKLHTYINIWNISAKVLVNNGKLCYNIEKF